MRILAYLGPHPNNLKPCKLMYLPGCYFSPTYTRVLEIVAQIFLIFRSWAITLMFLSVYKRCINHFKYIQTIAGQVPKRVGLMTQV